MNCAVVGIGKLGLCFALHLEKMGANVIGVDVSPEYIEKINSKTLFSQEPGLVEALQASSRFTATTDLEWAVKNSKFIFILVQTPETEHSYDHTLLQGVIAQIASMPVDPKHIIVNSTVLPGFLATQNVGPHTLSYNPAFVAQGTIIEDYHKGGKFGIIVAGTTTPEVKDALTTLYKGATIKFMTPASAEIFKIADNTFRVVKIVYANLIADLCKKTEGAVVDEVADALKSDISIGSICMTPGYGYGGPCYPRDIKALANYAMDLGYSPGLLGGAQVTNEEHHKTIVKEFLEKNLDEYIFESAYRPGMKVPLTDNSPSLRVANELKGLGKNVIIRD